MSDDVATALICAVLGVGFVVLPALFAWLWIASSRDEKERIARWRDFAAERRRTVNGDVSAMTIERNGCRVEVEQHYDRSRRKRVTAFTAPVLGGQRAPPAACGTSRARMSEKLRQIPGTAWRTCVSSPAPYWISMRAILPPRAPRGLSEEPMRQVPIDRRSSPAACARAIAPRDRPPRERVTQSAGGGWVSRSPRTRRLPRRAGKVGGGKRATRDPSRGDVIV